MCRRRAPWTGVDGFCSRGTRVAAPNRSLDTCATGGRTLRRIYLTAGGVLLLAAVAGFWFFAGEGASTSSRGAEPAVADGTVGAPTAYGDRVADRSTGAAATARGSGGDGPGGDGALARFFTSVFERARGDGERRVD